MDDKKRIRQEMELLKKDFSINQQESEAKMVFEKLESLPEFQHSEVIFIYWSLPDELPTHDFIEKWNSRKAILLPAISGNEMTLKRFVSKNEMKQGLLGIYEPDRTENYMGKIDLVIVPGMAFDRNLNRLGRGKGFYDRFFEKNNTPKIGICFDFQLIYSVPVSPNDVRMDKIITPSTIL